MVLFSKIKPLVEGIKAQQGASAEVENDVAGMGEKARGAIGNGMIGRLAKSVMGGMSAPSTEVENAASSMGEKARGAIGNGMIGKLVKSVKSVSTAKPQSVLNQVMDEEEDKKPMGMKKGGAVRKTKKYSSGGSVSSASKRGDGCAQRGKTKGRMV